MDAEQSKQAASVATVAMTQLGAVGIICVLVIGAFVYGIYSLAPPLATIAAATLRTASDVAEMQRHADALRSTSEEHLKMLVKINEGIEKMNRQLASRTDISPNLTLSSGEGQ